MYARTVAGRGRSKGRSIVSPGAVAAVLQAVAGNARARKIRETSEAQEVADRRQATARAWGLVL